MLGYGSMIDSKNTGKAAITKKYLGVDNLGDADNPLVYQTSQTPEEREAAQGLTNESPFSLLQLYSLSDSPRSAPPLNGPRPRSIAGK